MHTKWTYLLNHPSSPPLLLKEGLSTCSRLASNSRSSCLSILWPCTFHCRYVTLEAMLGLFSFKTQVVTRCLQQRSASLFCFVTTKQINFHFPSQPVSCSYPTIRHKVQAARDNTYMDSTAIHNNLCSVGYRCSDLSLAIESHKKAHWVLYSMEKSLSENFLPLPQTHTLIIHRISPVLTPAL